MVDAGEDTIVCVDALPFDLNILAFPAGGIWDANGSAGLRVNEFFVKTRDIQDSYIVGHRYGGTLSDPFGNGKIGDLKGNLGSPHFRIGDRREIKIVHCNLPT